MVTFLLKCGLVRFYKNFGHSTTIRLSKLQTANNFNLGWLKNLIYFKNSLYLRKSTFL